LLHISFTKDPPDELNLGAKFLGGIPFPFITIRTNKLEVGTWPNLGHDTCPWATRSGPIWPRLLCLAWPRPVHEPPALCQQPRFSARNAAAATCSH
jgi:hypothetical protein